MITLTCIALVLSFGRAMWSHQVGRAVVLDAAWILLFGAFLIGTRRPAA